jgi:hypothetical protein
MPDAEPVPMAAIQRTFDAAVEFGLTREEACEALGAALDRCSDEEGPRAITNAVLEELARRLEEKCKGRPPGVRHGRMGSAPTS